MIKLRTLLAEGVLDTSEVRDSIKDRANQEAERLQLSLEDAVTRTSLKNIAVGKIDTTVSMDSKQPEAQFHIVVYVTVDKATPTPMTVEKSGKVVAQVGSSGLPEFHVVRDTYVAKKGGKEVWKEKTQGRAEVNILVKMFRDLRSSNTVSPSNPNVLQRGPSKPPIGNRGSAVGPYDSTVAG